MITTRITKTMMRGRSTKSRRRGFIGDPWRGVLPRACLVASEEDGDLFVQFESITLAAVTALLESGDVLLHGIQALLALLVELADEGGVAGAEVAHGQGEEDGGESGRYE
jgi:hypothetical protein